MWIKVLNLNSVVLDCYWIFLIFINILGVDEVLSKLRYICVG